MPTITEHEVDKDDAWRCDRCGREGRTAASRVDECGFGWNALYAQHLHLPRMYKCCNCMIIDAYNPEGAR